MTPSLPTTECQCIRSGRHMARDPRDVVVDTRDEKLYTIDKGYYYGTRQQEVFQCARCGGWYVKIGGR